LNSSKLSQRQQIICLSPKIRPKRKLIQDRTVRTGKRGPYKNRGALTQRNEDAIDDDTSDGERGEDMGCEDVEIAIPEGCFLADGNTLLPNEIWELYNFLTRRQAPKAFLKAVNNDPTMGTAAKAKLQNF
jgi:hypothetical protein